MPVFNYEEKLNKYIKKMDAGDKSAVLEIRELAFLNFKKDSIDDIYDQAYALLADFSIEETDEENIAKIAGLFDDNSGTMYNIALNLENEDQMEKAICMYYIAALYGCKKAEYTLINMGNPESCYFVDNNYPEKGRFPKACLYRKVFEADDGSLNPDTASLVEQGMQYYEGTGVEKSFGRTFYYFYIAALRGDKNAQNNLGDMYYNGDGVPQDYEEALKWYKKSAGQNNAAAQYNLGVMYHNGLGVPQDYEEAEKWYRKSAEQDYEDAQYNLGVMYQNGLGVPQNDEEALKWYKKSAEQNNAEAQYNLGLMYQNGLGAPQNDEEALKWYKKSAGQNNADAQYNLGVMYHSGLGVPQDYEEAIKWYRKSANQKYANAQNNMGWLYQNGFGVEQDYEEAAKWYQKAIAGGCDLAKNNYEDLRSLLNNPQESRQEEIRLPEPEVPEYNINTLNFEELGKILIKIRDKFSVEIFSERKRLLSLLSDYCPVLKTEHFFLSKMYDFGIIDVFVNEKTDNKQEREMIINNMKEDLVNVRRINADDVDGCLKMLTHVFEWDSMVDML